MNSVSMRKTDYVIHLRYFELYMPNLEELIVSENSLSYISFNETSLSLCNMTPKIKYLDISNINNFHDDGKSTSN